MKQILPGVAFVLSGTWGIIAVTGSWKDGKIPVGKSLDKCSEEWRDPPPFLSPHSLKKKPQRFMFMKSFFCLFVFAFKYLKKKKQKNTTTLQWNQWLSYTGQPDLWQGFS